MSSLRDDGTRGIAVAGIVLSALSLVMSGVACHYAYRRSAVAGEVILDVEKSFTPERGFQILLRNKGASPVRFGKLTLVEEGKPPIDVTSAFMHDAVRAFFDEKGISSVVYFRDKDPGYVAESGKNADYEYGSMTWADDDPLKATRLQLWEAQLESWFTHSLSAGEGVALLRVDTEWFTTGLLDVASFNRFASSRDLVVEVVGESREIHTLPLDGRRPGPDSVRRV